MISTGLPKLDYFLGGGIKKGIIIDIFGSSGTGKTQFSLQICINALKNGGKVLFLDTTGGFRPERSFSLIKSQNLDPSILDNIIVGRITNVSEQIKYLEKFSEISNLELVLIDNVTDLFSFEYSRDSNMLEKHVLFMKYMHDLSANAIQKKLPIVVTNMVRDSLENERENLERSISIYTHQKIHLLKKTPKFVAKITPSFGKIKEVSYNITNRGLEESS